MQRAGALYVFEFAPDLANALADQPAVDFELAFAGAAEKTKPAALALEMGPGANEARALIGQRRELDLEPPFIGASTGAKDLENEPGAVDDLGLPAPLQIALLHGRHRAVDDHEADLLLLDRCAERIDAAAAD